MLYYYPDIFFVFNPHPRIRLLILEREEGGERDREREREREREKRRGKHGCERETLTGCLPYAPPCGIKPTAFFLVYGMMLHLTEPPGQGLTSLNIILSNCQMLNYNTRIKGILE